jgi:hypothetical protein
MTGSAFAIRAANRAFLPVLWRTPGVELMHMIRKASCVRQANCVQRSSSVRWRGKPVHIPGPSSSAREVCDRTV